MSLVACPSARRRQGYVPGADIHLQPITEGEGEDGEEQGTDSSPLHPSLPKLCTNPAHSHSLHDGEACSGGGSGGHVSGQPASPAHRSLSRGSSRKRRTSGFTGAAGDDLKRHDSGIQTTTLRTKQPLDLDK